MLSAHMPVLPCPPAPGGPPDSSVCPVTPGVSGHVPFPLPPATFAKYTICLPSASSRAPPWRPCPARSPGAAGSTTRHVPVTVTRGHDPRESQNRLVSGCHQHFYKTTKLRRRGKVWGISLHSCLGKLLKSSVCVRVSTCVYVHVWVGVHVCAHVCTYMCELCACTCVVDVCVHVCACVCMCELCACTCVA